MHRERERERERETERERERERERQSEREDIFRFIKLKWRLCAVDPNKAKITFRRQRIGLCDKVLIWIIVFP